MKERKMDATKVIIVVVIIIYYKLQYGLSIS